MGFWDWLMGTPAQNREMPAKRKGSVALARGATVLTIAVGDVVSYDGTDYVVKNKITYEDDGFEWYDYLLLDAATDKELWLSAEDDDGLEVGIFEDTALEVPPVPKSITRDGKTYRQVEHSTASVQLEREDDTRSTHAKVEYWEYEAPGGHYLTINRWGGEYEASVGKAIKEYELKIYPAMA